MKAAAAIITEHGGRTCHAAIVARELGIPAIVGVEHALEQLQQGQTVTVSCAEGDTGYIYAGDVPYQKTIRKIGEKPALKQQVMLNVGSPELAFSLHSLPCDGVGLARMEFIINEHIKAHPLALLHPQKMTDHSAQQQVQQLIKPYQTGKAFFITKLAEGIGTIAAAFYPRPVIVRFSDFKTNEYAHLLGGTDFEPHEANPMLGFRGASRYIHPAYAEAVCTGVPSN